MGDVPRAGTFTVAVWRVTHMLKTLWLNPDFGPDGGSSAWYQACGLVRCVIMWCGVICGVVVCGVVWCGVIWYNVEWCGVVWYPLG